MTVHPTPAQPEQVRGPLAHTLCNTVLWHQRRSHHNQQLGPLEESTPRHSRRRPTYTPQPDTRDTRRELARKKMQPHELVQSHRELMTKQDWKNIPSGAHTNVVLAFKVRSLPEAVLEGVAYVRETTSRRNTPQVERNCRNPEQEASAFTATHIHMTTPRYKQTLCLALSQHRAGSCSRSLAVQIQSNPRRSRFESWCQPRTLEHHCCASVRQGMEDVHQTGKKHTGEGRWGLPQGPPRQHKPSLCTAPRTLEYSCPTWIQTKKSLVLDTESDCRTSALEELPSRQQYRAWS
jgi:hypothetical protein